MKRNSLFKGIMLSVAVSAVLTGCGSETKSDINLDDENIDKIVKATTISGKAIDGYLQYSTVCLDISQDGYCQSTEPMTTTLKDGSFTLDISPEIQKMQILQRLCFLYMVVVIKILEQTLEESYWLLLILR